MRPVQISLRAEFLDERIVPSVTVGLTAIGSSPGELARATVFDPDGSVRFEVEPFGPDFRGGVRVALGDVTGNRIPDLIVGAGPGGSPLVKVYDGNTGKELASFRAFEDAFRGGVYVAAGDFNQDGRDDIIITPDEGGGPRVRIISGKDQSTTVADFFGIDDVNFRGGARAAVGDVNGNGITDLIVAAGFGGGPRIAVFDGLTVTDSPSRIVDDFFAFEPELRNGAFVASGDLNNNGLADLVFGGGPGGGPRVLAVSSKTLINQGERAAFDSPIANFFAGDSQDRNGVRVAVGRTSADGQPQILTSGPGGVVSTFSVNGRPTDSPGDGRRGGFVTGTPVVVSPITSQVPNPTGQNVSPPGSTSTPGTSTPSTPSSTSTPSTQAPSLRVTLNTPNAFNPSALQLIGIGYSHAAEGAIALGEITIHNDGPPGSILNFQLAGSLAAFYPLLGSWIPYSLSASTPVGQLSGGSSLRVLIVANSGPWSMSLATTQIGFVDVVDRNGVLPSQRFAMDVLPSVQASNAQTAHINGLIQQQSNLFGSQWVKSFGTFS